MNRINKQWTKNWKFRQRKYNGQTGMTNFEKIMLCRYVISFLDFMDLNRYYFDDFYETLIYVLGLKTNKCPKLNIEQKKNFSQTQDFKKELKQILAKRLSEIKHTKSSLENKILLLKNFFGLDQTEHEYLLYYILKLVNPMIDDLNEYFASELKEFDTLGIQVLKLKSWVISQVRYQLMNKGIFQKDYSHCQELYLTPQIQEIFQNHKIKSNTQIKNILLGKNQKSELNWNDFEYLASERDRVLNILNAAVQNHTKGVNILLYGTVGTGKTQFAKLIANKAKVDMYAVGSEFEDVEATRQERLGDLATKQTVLNKIDNSCILFDEAEDVMNRGFGNLGSASKSYLNTLLEESSVPVFWTTNNIYNVDPAFLRRMTYTVEFKKLPDDIRLNIWKRVIRKNKFKVDYSKLKELNKNYEIPPSLIVNAVQTTKLIDGNQDDFEIFVENVAQVVTKKKNVKKKKGVEMTEYNDNLINTDIDIKDLTSRIKTSGRLNFSLCLYGEPGTGKSLYARYLAKELGIEVILKRASDLISKYVGETEENIANAFAEAKSKEAMLIFDEADTFLQNRQNAVRSWEVSQVNEMLTWMESHEYPFVCTTNLLDTLDEASLRRFTFKIKFDFMTKEQVNKAIEHFFGIKNADVNIKGLTAGDFATVKKKADFLGIKSLDELSRMLQQEVKVKKSNELKTTVGF